MDFWRTVMVVIRRWYIAVPAFVATIAIGVAAYSTLPVEYESNGILVLTTPLSGGSESTSRQQPRSITNPLMNFDQSLALAASIVIQQLSSSETAQALDIVPGAATGYAVNNGSTNPELLQTGPFIFVQGTAPNPQTAQDVARKVSAMAATVLAERQDALNAPASTHISLEVVVPPTMGQPLTGSAKRAAAALAALAGLGSLAAVYGFESMMIHRRRRRTERRRQYHHATAPVPELDTAGVGTLQVAHPDSVPERT